MSGATASVCMPQVRRNPVSSLIKYESETTASIHVALCAFQCILGKWHLLLDKAYERTYAAHASVEQREPHHVLLKILVPSRCQDPF